MSRIIVKNLPKKISEQKLRNVFASKGDITDLQLKYTKDGVFRQFAFIGYRTEEEAQSAKSYFHNTYISSSKIQVEICADLGDANKPRPWSKHSKDKLEVKKKTELPETLNMEKKKKNKANKDQEIPDELLKSPLFAEFLEVRKAGKPLWADDVGNLEEQKIDEDEGQKTDEKETSGEGEIEEESVDSNIAKSKSISDFEYLKSKIKPFVSEVNDDPATKPSGKSKTLKTDAVKNRKEKTLDNLYTVKLRNLPFRCKKKQIKKFFHPVKPRSLRIPPKLKGFAYAMFRTEKEMKQALIKHKSILDGHRVDVVKYEKKITAEHVIEKEGGVKDKQAEEELLAESGRIFVRNLCFSVTEEELEAVFSKYGPLAEIHLPIDSYSKKGLGYAFVSYVFAEHAVKAFTERDGTIFQGRLLHLIPGKPKKETTVDVNELPFKKRKEAKLKALSGSSHNWNTLFLGMNAVADVIAKQYNIEKAELLNNEDKDSIAVRMALGETQLVVEAREFLLEHGVQLDSFGQAAAPHSKTVILAKNLPAKTPPSEIHDVFSKFGVISRVILPPSGITALIEFQQGTEAKMAFKKLAYTRFHHMPLYLEWAPLNVFKSDSAAVKEQTKEVAEEKTHEVETAEERLGTEDDNDDPEPEPGTTLFVKNFNFETTEDIVKQHFKKCGPLHSVSISRKKDIKSGKLLSMGFGFVQYKNKSSASRALQDLQFSELDGHKLEIKFSNKATLSKTETGRKKAVAKEQKSSKIMVRNIPFEVTQNEIRDLFKEFGNLRTVRLPKKPSGQGSHRGFGFVDFTSKENAKRAFNALCHSTHLLGRRLVLEWANPEADGVEHLRKKTAHDFFTGGPSAKVKKSKLREDVMLAASKTAADDDDVD